MADIIKTYRQSVGALRFIGKKYGDADRVNGNFSAKWGEWCENGWFSVLDKLSADYREELHEDGEAYIGLMRYKDGEPFEYWIGVFVPKDAGVPDGFAYVDFPKSEWGVGWVRGKENEVYFQEEKVGAALVESGFELTTDENGAAWFFERYADSRFSPPDENGNIIVDICHFIK